ncbi:hypothetical protein Tco_1006565 [Tanacetum coccineum]|uniref:Uncharacterized protein n=1 Tax=Tanacetum coccineum TaxID=301880 RepID=A0ABQ5FI81_9ASTR
MYLTASRPDIMFAVCACARFYVTPKTSHLLAVKRIFRYLKGKPTLGLWYSRDSPFELVAYTDSDYAGATQDRKSTTGGCQFLGNRLISWQCKKQTVVATSTTEVEYVVAASYCKTNLLTKGFDAGRFQYLVSSSGPRCQDTILGDVDAQTRFGTTSKQSNDPPLSRGYILGSGEDSMKLLELMELCTKLSKMLHKNRQSDLATAKANTVNGERQLQALIDKKKVIITESSFRSDLHLEDAGGTDCLPTATIFEELTRMGAKSTVWNEFSSIMASLIICLATNQKFNLSKYIFDAMVKHLDGGVKFLMYLRFLQVFINQQLGDMSHHKKIYVNPSHTKKIFANMRREGKDFSRRITPLFETMMVQPTQDEGKQSKRKQRKDAAVTQEETQQDDSVPIPSNDPPISAKEIADLKKRVQKLERRTTGLKRLRKVGMSRRVESPEDKDSLGDHEDASKQGRSIEDIDKDVDVSLVDDTQGRSDDADMFDTIDLHGDEVNVDMLVGEKQEQSAKEREVDTSVEDSIAPTTIEEITLAQTLIQIKAAKPKVVTTAATTTKTTRPKARGVVVHKPIALDEDLARNLQAYLEAELIEEERIERKKEEEANIALIESWDNTQAMMEEDFELAQRLQTEE